MLPLPLHFLPASCAHIRQHLLQFCGYTAALIAQELEVGHSLQEHLQELRLQGYVHMMNAVRCLLLDGCIPAAAGLLLQQMLLQQKLQGQPSGWQDEATDHPCSGALHKQQYQTSGSQAIEIQDCTGQRQPGLHKPDSIDDVQSTGVCTCNDKQLLCDQ